MSKHIGCKVNLALALFFAVSVFVSSSATAQASENRSSDCERVFDRSNAPYTFQADSSDRLYLVLEPNVDEIVKRMLGQVSAEIRNSLSADSMIGHRRSVEDGKLIVSLSSRFATPEQMDEAETRIRKHIPKRRVFFFEYPLLNLERSGDFTFELHTNKNALKNLLGEAQAKTMAVVRRRLDPEGEYGISISPIGTQQIELTTPPVDDLDAFKETITRRGQVYFAMASSMAEGPNSSIWRLLPFENDQLGCLWVNESSPIVTSDGIRSASQGIDEYQRPQINFNLTQAGIRTFSEATLQYPGRLFAIVLDGEIISAPRINDPIFGSGVRITGDFTLEEAITLSSIIEAGELPASVSIVEERVLSLDALEQLKATQD